MSSWRYSAGLLLSWNLVVGALDVGDDLTDPQESLLRLQNHVMGDVWYQHIGSCMSIGMILSRAVVLE